MRAFEVYLNGKRLCVAGIGDDGVLNTIVDHVIGNGHDDLFMHTGGLLVPAMEHVTWTRRNLRLGDEVRVKIIETNSVDRPKTRHRSDPKEDLRIEKQHVRKLARKFGWKIIPAAAKKHKARPNREARR